MTDCFLVDLSSIQFSEGTAKWIHALAPGEYDHPLRGKLKFTADRLQRFADNVKNRVRGIDLDIDYDHKTKVDHAAGWVKDAEARPDGLWLLVEFTRNALQKLADKEYRYFSTDYQDMWADPKTGQQIQDVLNGGALTNRPFVKDLTPINLSEVLGGRYMNPELLKLLGLPEDADQATFDAKVKELAEAASAEPVVPPTPPAPPANTDPVPPAPTPPVVEVTPSSDPAMVALAEELEAVKAELRHRNVTELVTKLSEGEAFTIAPTMLDEIKALALNSPKGVSDQWMALLTKVKNEGIVQLGEVGANPNPDPTLLGEDSATVRLDKMTEALMLSEKTLTYADAFMRISNENPDLTREYRNESYMKEGA